MRLPYLATLLLTTLSGISAAFSIPESYGPIGYPGTSPRVTEAGVEAPNFHFDPLLVPKPRAWESQWIWLPKGNAPVVYFRKEILFGLVSKICGQAPVQEARQDYDIKRLAVQ